MAVSLKKSAKSETLTIRLDPKSRFMLEFLARLRGQTITTVVERAISDAAARETIETENLFNGAAEHNTWRDYWSVSEAERSLRIAAIPQVHPTFEEERRLDFAKRWWQFFFNNQHATVVDRQFADILWPSIDHFIEVEEKNRSTNALAAGDAMAGALREAGLMPPDWVPANAEIPF